jgi:hypothetical protein
VLSEDEHEQCMLVQISRKDFQSLYARSRVVYQYCQFQNVVNPYHKVFELSKHTDRSVDKRLEVKNSSKLECQYKP